MNPKNNPELNERLNRLSPEKRARLALMLSKAVRQDRPQKTPALPKTLPEPQNRFDQFPLSDIQQAYLIGREEGVELGNIACHNYFEVDVADWDQKRFEAALDKLIRRHEMLRCIVLPEGRQQILKEVPRYQVKCADLQGQNPSSIEAHLEKVRREMAHYVHPTDVWPLFEFRASILGPQRTRLHIGFDLLIADGRSFEIIFGELAALYRDLNLDLPSLELSFRDYLSAFNKLEETEAFHASRDYWIKRLPTLPASPDLPFAANPASIQKPLFKRRQARLNQASWKAVKEKTARAGLTPRSFAGGLRGSARHLEQEPAFHNQSHLVQSIAVAWAGKRYRWRFHFREPPRSGQFEAGRIQIARAPLPGAVVEDRDHR